VPEDPYTDPVTGVLHNKLGLRTPEELQAAEREITHAALIFLKESPVAPSYDLGHLCAIHRRIFARSHHHIMMRIRYGAMRFAATVAPSS
jgi:cell filamentation protein